MPVSSVHESKFSGYVVLALVGGYLTDYTTCPDTTVGSISNNQSLINRSAFRTRDTGEVNEKEVSVSFTQRL